MHFFTGRSKKETDCEIFRFQFSDRELCLLPYIHN